MAFNMGGGSKTSQTQHQLQVGVSGGVGYGGASGRGAIGGGGSGNITGGIKNVGVFNQTVSDHNAVNAGRDMGLASLKSMQELSTLAVGYANQNSNQAMQALQAIGTQAQVAAAGGNAAEVAGATTTTANTVGMSSQTKAALVVVAGLAVLFAIYCYY